VLCDRNSALAGLDDEQLVLNAQQGDTGAFAELVQRHQNICKRLAFSVLRDRLDAEDEVQNAFYKAFEHIGRFQREARFSTWLSRIVLNQCLMRLRKERRMRYVYVDECVPGEETTRFDVVDGTASPEQALARQEVGSVLKSEIKRIPPLLRDVFELRDVNELPMNDVACRLGISVAAAKSRLLRARLELRSRMGAHVGRLGAASLTP